MATNLNEALLRIVRSEQGHSASCKDLIKLLLLERSLKYMFGKKKH